MSTPLRLEPIVNGLGTAFAMKFDRAVDHAGSLFIVVDSTGARRPIRLRLGAQPNTLYGSVARLDPGCYILEWHLRATDGSILSGDAPFMTEDSRWPC